MTLKLAITILPFALAAWFVVKSVRAIKKPSNYMSDGWKKNEYWQHDNVERARWDSYWK